MSYQALLFCPDEKTARVVSQVLSELEFTVEPCHEPFSAVKKLMVQHFDALVVDCDNEQNAALLFKSARNSGSNQASLAVAVVEGQAGVAKAFRLGANLVLTKPIHVEQSKGTLRVARGLLRKGQAAKAAAAAPTAASSDDVYATIRARAVSAATKECSASIAERFCLRARRGTHASARCRRRRAARVHAGLARFRASRIRRAHAAESDPSKQYPWQPRKPLAEPMASALRRAAEAAGKSEFDAAAPRPTAARRPCTPQASAYRKPLFRKAESQQQDLHRHEAGAAAAPARAKEIPAPDAKKLGLEPTASAIAAPSTTEETEIKRIEDPSASDGWDSHSASVARHGSTRFQFAR